MPETSGTSRAVAMLIALGALLYTARVLELLLATGLDPVRAYASELSAADRPFGRLFRSTDLAAGLLVLAGSATALPTLPRRPWCVADRAALAAFGPATAVDSRLPLSCAPTGDPECAAPETAGLVPATHTAHAYSSTLAMAGAPAGPAALTVAARRYHRWPALGRGGPVLLAVQLAATVWTLTAVAAFEAGRGVWWLGAGQRLQVLTATGWLAVLALSVARGSAGPPGRGTGGKDRPDAVARAVMRH
ncbi:DUF998 domain-containing protein [Streptomyces spongiicola]|uniref:DUF998 domain-containing protein n=1 Tax=Streptomyces spongiicola TaxID=1690221 RepID=A0ABN5KIE4_9ACTN|nr:DUF998 domain-containing protein [Streptomyces spongiicola]AWK08226.1 DUF998 domain-containing protein [Streptomyces spongiicola]